MSVAVLRCCSMAFRIVLFALQRGMSHCMILLGVCCRVDAVLIWFTLVFVDVDGLDRRLVAACTPAGLLRGQQAGNTCYISVAELRGAGAWHVAWRRFLFLCRRVLWVKLVSVD